MLKILISSFACVAAFANIKKLVKPKPTEHKKTQGMLVGTALNGNSGMIIFPNYEATVKCKIENKRIYVEDKCPACNSDEVKNYKCAHCGNKLQYNKYSERI